MKKGIGFIRVSSKVAADVSLSRQKRELRKKAATLGVEIQHIIASRDPAGLSPNILGSFLNEFREDGIESVVVWDMSRISRDPGQVEKLRKKMAKADISLEYVK